MRLVHEEIRRAFQALEEICELDDQVEIDAEVQDLMADPTKARASTMYESCIGLWFMQEDHKGNAHPDVEWVREKYL